LSTRRTPAPATTRSPLPRRASQRLNRRTRPLRSHCLQDVERQRPRQPTGRREPPKSIHERLPQRPRMVVEVVCRPLATDHPIAPQRPEENAGVERVLSVPETRLNDVACAVDVDRADGFVVGEGDGGVERGSDGAARRLHRLRFRLEGVAAARQYQ
jgi:hypothetical protein